MNNIVDITPEIITNNEQLDIIEIKEIAEAHNKNFKAGKEFLDLIMLAGLFIAINVAHQFSYEHNPFKSIYNLTAFIDIAIYIIAIPLVIGCLSIAILLPLWVNSKPVKFTTTYKNILISEPVKNTIINELQKHILTSNDDTIEDINTIINRLN